MFESKVRASVHLLSFCAFSISLLFNHFHLQIWVNTLTWMDLLFGKWCSSSETHAKGISMAIKKAANLFNWTTWIYIKIKRNKLIKFSFSTENGMSAVRLFHLFLVLYLFAIKAILRFWRESFCWTCIICWNVKCTETPFSLRHHIISNVVGNRNRWQNFDGFRFQDLLIRKLMGFKVVPFLSHF